jgi:hypothetical protein
VWRPTADPHLGAGVARKVLGRPLTTSRMVTLLRHSRPRVQVSTNEDPMTSLMLRTDAIDRLALQANGSFRLPATKSGHRREIDRRRRQG